MKKARGQGGHRLRVPHDRPRSARRRPRRHGHDGPRRGRHQLQAVHGLPGRVHGGRRDDLPGAAQDRRERRPGLHARRERRRDRRARQGGAAQGAEGAEVSRAHAARRGPRARRPAARSRSPKWPACRSTSSTCRRRTRWRRCAGARHGPAGVRRDLPAVSVPLLRQLRGAGLRRRQVRDVAAAAREVAPGRAVEGAREERPAGDLDRPLPVLHERAEEALGKDDFRKIPNGAPGHRDPADARAQRRRAPGPHHAEPLRRARARRRRRRCSASSRARARSPSAATPTSSSSTREGADARRQDAPHARGLQPVRGHAWSRARRAVVISQRQGDHRGRQVRRQEGRAAASSSAARAWPGGL